MTRGTTERVIQTLLAASAALDDSVRVVQEEASESVFRDYRQRAGEVMAAIYLDLIKPLVKNYPDLDPGRDDTDRR